LAVLQRQAPKGFERPLRGAEISRLEDRKGSNRARRAVKDLPFATWRRAAGARAVAVHRIADVPGGACRRYECRLDGSHRELARRRPAAPYAAQPPTANRVSASDWPPPADMATRWHPPRHDQDPYGAAARLAETASGHGWASPKKCHFC